MFIVVIPGDPVCAFGPFASESAALAWGIASYDECDFVICLLAEPGE